MLKGHSGEAETLDEKIKRIRKKNEEIEKRRLEVEADKQSAAKLNALVQLNAPMEDWPLPRSHSPEEERERKFSGIHQDKHRERTRGNVTFGDTDESNRPPPDPAYRFLADSERDPLPPKHLERSQRHPHSRGHNVTRGRSRDSKGGAGAAGPGYEAWRAERSRIDQERIRRQRTDQGLWRREWDVHKSEEDWKEPRNEKTRDSHSTSNRASRSNIPPESTKDIIIKRRTFSEESKGEISVRSQKNIGNWDLREKQDLHSGAPAENRNIQNRGNSLHVSFGKEPSLVRGPGAEGLPPRRARPRARGAPTRGRGRGRGRRAAGGGKSSGDGDDSWEDADDHSDEPAAELALARAHARARARARPPAHAQGDSAPGGGGGAAGTSKSSAVHVGPDTEADRSPFENVNADSNASPVLVPVPSSAVEKIEEPVVATGIESECSLGTSVKEDRKDDINEQATNLPDILRNESDTDFICSKTSNEEMNINTENTSTISGSSTLCETKTDIPVMNNETENVNISSASCIQDTEGVNILQNPQLGSIDTENTTIASSSTLCDTKTDISIVKNETENVNISSASGIEDRESVNILPNPQVDSVDAKNTSIAGSSTLCDIKTDTSIMTNETENVNISSASDIQDTERVNVLPNPQVDSIDAKNTSIAGSSTPCDTKTDISIMKNETENVNISSASGIQDRESVNFIQNSQIDSINADINTLGDQSTISDTKADIPIMKNETENVNISSASGIQVKESISSEQNPQVDSIDAEKTTIAGSSTVCDTKTDIPIVKNETEDVNILSASGLQDSESVNILQNTQVDSIDTESISTIGGSSTLCDTKTDIPIGKNETENGNISSASAIQDGEGNCLQNSQLNSEQSTAVHPAPEEH